MASTQKNEIAVNDAVKEAFATAVELSDLAKSHRDKHKSLDQCSIERIWSSHAGTYVYQTHIAVTEQALERFSWLTDTFFHAASLPAQPWYTEFQGGKHALLATPPPEGVEDHQLCWGRFDLGMPTPRYYRQLVSLIRPTTNSAVIVARSVNDGALMPDDARLAFTLSPNGEVLFWENNCLHWHHICCTPGAGILAGRGDRWLINIIRCLRLDQLERKTYRKEAEQLRDWLQSATPQYDVG
jgi:hypothetical protein